MTKWQIVKNVSNCGPF